jgi:hypothetical protein
MKICFFISADHNILSALQDIKNKLWLNFGRDMAKVELLQKESIYFAQDIIKIVLILLRLAENVPIVIKRKLNASTNLSLNLKVRRCTFGW